MLCLFGACLAEAGSPPGAVVAWGYNADGETDVPAGLTNAVMIAGGQYHSLALQSNGTLVAWGYNGSGQITAPKGLSNVVAVAAGGWHSLALQSGGTVVAWGDNQFGQTNVPSGLNNVVSVAAGYYHNLALQSSGAVVAWGYKADGAAAVPSGLNNAGAISAGYAHSLALQRNGTVVAWGANYYGQTTVPPGLSNVVAIAAGGYQSLALQSNGTVVAWGSNALGQTNVPSGLSNVLAVAGGGEHSLAITTGPAILSAPPPSISLTSGARTNLSVSMWPGSPFNFQWSFNGQPITGATNASLVISNFDLTKAGTYAIAVTNQYAYGTALTVLRFTNSPVVLVDGIDAGGGTVSRVDTSHITISSTFGSNPAIYYTLDGSTPDFTATTYSGAFTLTNSATIRAIAYNSAYTAWVEAAPIYVQVSPTYPLSATTPGGGSLSVSPAPYAAGNLYLSNTLITLTATPSNGWFFVGWTGDSTDTNNVTTVLMDGPRTVQAVFQMWATYPLSASTTGGGSVSVSPPPYAAGNLYLSNSLVTLTATPLNGWSFVGWAGDSTNTTSVTTIVMDQPRAVQALFGTSLNLFTNGSGQVLLDPPAGPYLFGSTVQLTAVPSQGSYFFGWSGAASGFANPLVFNVTDASGITALFGVLRTNQALLTVLPSANGTVAIDPAKSVYAIGDTVTLTAVPANGYVFASWGGDASGGMNPLVFALSTNTLISASFALAPPTNFGPVLQTVTQFAGTFTFTWSTVTGRTYQVQYSTDLLQTDWSNLGSPAVATNTTMSASDTIASGPAQRWYRVALLP